MNRAERVQVSGRNVTVKSKRRIGARPGRQIQTNVGRTRRARPRLPNNTPINYSKKVKKNPRPVVDGRVSHIRMFYTVSAMLLWRLAAVCRVVR